ncbi:class I SAM-dependent methyltransferase [Bacillus sp. FJAT-42376]|uniref:class I SAM-dependent methyltransferase n=1 Tax=Bacillus sp. FJAT-42376 TaxID=2014076 RepID=UPI000F4F7508|nr:class I SAM-dependent methyltransferase [Bacillus sp. FJAT-42376]AZB41245.1 class I SAM-dependent methyltransferase [Bacillus sp. FJAT-42376]
MSDHYYSENPTVQSNKKSWSFDLAGHSFTFRSDSGVFSKNEVDFGSRVLIESFEMPEVPGNILDMGCGYGPIGLSLAKKWPERNVDMADINSRAVELAKENAEFNGIQNAAIFQSDLFSKVADKAYAAILTNPPIRAGKKVVHEILEKSFEHLCSGGELWAVIQKKQGAPSAVAKLEEHFDEVDVVQKKKGYYIIRAKKD